MLCSSAYACTLLCIVLLLWKIPVVGDEESAFVAEGIWTDTLAELNGMGELAALKPLHECVSLRDLVVKLRTDDDAAAAAGGGGGGGDPQAVRPAKGGGDKTLTGASGKWQRHLTRQVVERRLLSEARHVASSTPFGQALLTVLQEGPQLCSWTEIVPPAEHLWLPANAFRQALRLRLGLSPQDGEILCHRRACKETVSDNPSHLHGCMALRGSGNGRHNIEVKTLASVMMEVNPLAVIQVEPHTRTLTAKRYDDSYAGGGTSDGTAHGHQ